MSKITKWNTLFMWYKNIVIFENISKNKTYDILWSVTSECYQRIENRYNAKVFFKISDPS